MKVTPFSLRNVMRLAQGRMPGQVIIQYTDRCNATCPQCDMRKQNDFQRSSLDVETGKRILDAAKERGVQAVSFTGGEPLLAKNDVLELIRHASELRIPYIRTGTNGFLFMGVDKPNWEKRVRELAESLAATNIYTFWISVDSLDDAVHENMRGLPGVMKGIEQALPIFREYGIYPSANLGINRNAGGDYQKLLPYEPDPEKFEAERFYDHFRRGFAGFYQKMADLGFTIINMCYPMSMDPADADGMDADGMVNVNAATDSPLAVYAATSLDRIIRFRPDEKVQLFSALLDTVPDYRDKLRIFTPLTSVLSLVRQYKEETTTQAYGCRGGVDFFFVNSIDANTYPCGYRGQENLGKFWDLDLQQVDTKRNCTDCDWECFRDPSEMGGPLLEFPRHPFAVASRFWSDREYARFWWRDVQYYRACNYFCGRRDIDYARLAKFRNQSQSAALSPAAASPPLQKDQLEQQPQHAV